MCACTDFHRFEVRIKPPLMFFSCLPCSFTATMVEKKGKQKAWTTNTSLLSDGRNYVRFFFLLLYFSQFSFCCWNSTGSMKNYERPLFHIVSLRHLKTPLVAYCCDHKTEVVPLQPRHEKPRILSFRNLSKLVSSRRLCVGEGFLSLSLFLSKPCKYLQRLDFRIPS